MQTMFGFDFATCRWLHSPHTAPPIKTRHCSIEVGRFMCRQQLSDLDISGLLKYFSWIAFQRDCNINLVERSDSRSSCSFSLIDCVMQSCRLHVYGRDHFVLWFFWIRMLQMSWGHFCHFSKWYETKTLKVQESFLKKVRKPESGNKKIKPRASHE